MSKILFVMSAADHWTLKDGTRHSTGFWAEEFLVPYRALTAAGHVVEVATPGGVAPVVDPASLNGEEAPVVPVAGRLTDVDLGAYAAIYFPGGHAPMEDLSQDGESAALIGKALTAGVPLALVCHGVAALLPVDPELVAGRRVTGFSNTEEGLAGLAPKASWLLEDRLVALGTTFTAGEPWQPYVVVDGALITGQNPASSEAVAAELLRAMTA
ncbi:type 1 glutamine amidotransferase domain-containing protein [Actinoplanes regularis]|uniref:Putative intracellular protease/amidase n=1 Tax=Actinoplanes regularis TaxID=52697 RepID=A0A239D0S6_9ACTN|nr:type 1 glutamine amidotransferase domain-containing protein [Actinoplanes regularis]GIE88466.1 dimethylallyltransferase [Actinoplanes regularis]GLW31168.1 dimethylallyltransferase [Actinoplanes regularis]SNS25907.1 Putative intracellular protease/amidase [Actinoplanes regularis]